MKRWSVFVVVGAVASVAFVAGASHSPGAKPAEEKMPEPAKPGAVNPDVAKPEPAKPAAVGHKIAVFNMAAVMRDFHLAKYQVWQLNNKRTELSKKMVALSAEYTQLQREAQPNLPVPEDKAKRAFALAREIEDEHRTINKQLNDDASAIIGELYDKIKVVVDKTAEKEGFQLVLAYPDAVTPDELQSPHIKELKLKPPAAQPFYVAREIDITARVIERLNELYPPLDPETGKPVDLSKLDGFPGPAPKNGPPIPLPPVPNVPGAVPGIGSPVPLPPVPAPKGRP